MQAIDGVNAIRTMAASYGDRLSRHLLGHAGCASADVAAARQPRGADVDRRGGAPRLALRHTAFALIGSSHQGIPIPGNFL